VTDQAYDRIGAGYAGRRRADPRLAGLITQALGGAETIVNVGAGSGSYEPADRFVVGVEPALTMIRQRRAGAAPVARGQAEALPFADGVFAAALAVLTIHHWRDWRAGLLEMRRVSRGRIVLLTWDPASEGFWIRDYFPELLAQDRQRFPDLRAIADTLGGAQVLPVAIPHDCADGFMGAYWRRPSAYLEAGVREAMSSFALGGGGSALARLSADLASGDWNRKYGNLLEQEELDLGYRLIVAGA